MGFETLLFYIMGNYAGVMLVVFAFIADLLLGDPRTLPHPVVLMGRLINLLERLLRPLTRGARLELAAGGLLAVLLLAFVYLLTRYVLVFIYGQHLYLGSIAALYLLYTSFSLKSLLEHIINVEQPLLQGKLESARAALSLLVGRDTDALPAAEISRGALESLAENSSDGVIGPLFYAFIGGAPLALAYKAVSTMDSMLGYRNERYLYFGRVAAKLDDLANYIPARLTAILLLFVSVLKGRVPRGRFVGHWQAIRREGKNHASPNSGYPEAAAAVLLDVRLGGTSSYKGVPSEKPLINAAGGEATPQHLKELRSLVYQASLLALFTGVVLFIVTTLLVAVF